MDNKSATRRAALKTGLGLLALTGAVGVATRASAQSSKADPSTVGYQTKPSGSAQCSNCSQFIAPAGCQLVSGTIAPNGWCELYSPKS